MTLYEFIFTNKPGKHLYRHIAFWGVLILHFIIQNLMVGGISEALKPRSFAASAFNALFFFPVYLLSVYTFINLVLPVYLFRSRYILFACGLISLLIIDFIACYFSGMLYTHIESHIPFAKITFDSIKYFAVVNGLFLPVTFFGIAGGIKLAKKWYLNQKENEQLVKEKISRELQLLKTQLQPRFLFHSLFSVKKHILSNSPFSAGLIISLSDLLSYILYESDKEWISLEKEFEIIKSYIELEKKSADSSLAADINISGNINDKYIPPLLLLTFIKNSFEYFLKDNPEKTTLKLDINVSENKLDYYLNCTRFANSKINFDDVKMKFIDLEKQLHYLYPANHKINIMTNSENIIIDLSIPVYIKNESDNKLPVSEINYQ